MPAWQYWTSWVVQVLGMLGTFLIATIALFGPWLRNWIAPPNLTIALASVEGWPSTLRIYDQAAKQTHSTPGIWYHVRVDNSTRWNPVTELYIFLLSVEERDAAGNYQRVWNGRAALGWRSDANPQPKKIGYTAECDLCHILKNPLQIGLSPIIPGEVPGPYTEECRIALTFQARGLERDSDLLRVEVSWDGKWSDDREQMMRHLVVRAT